MFKVWGSIGIPKVEFFSSFGTERAKPLSNKVQKLKENISGKSFYCSYFWTIL